MYMFIFIYVTYAYSVYWVYNVCTIAYTHTPAPEQEGGCNETQVRLHTLTLTHTYTHSHTTFKLNLDPAAAQRMCVKKWGPAQMSSLTQNVLTLQGLSFVLTTAESSLQLTHPPIPMSLDYGRKQRQK